MLSCWNCNTRITGIVVAPPSQPSASRAPLQLYEDAGGGGGGGASAAGEQRWSNEHWPLEAAGMVALGQHNNGMLGNGRGGRGGGGGHVASPQPLHRRHGNSSSSSSSSKEPRQQRWQRDQKTSSKGLRRCRAWIICRQDTIQALDIEVTDYGEPPPPPAPAAKHGGVGMNGASSGGGRGFQNGSSGRHAEVDIKVEEGREGEGVGGTGGRRGHRNGLGLAGGGSPGGGSPRFTPRRKTGGSCSIDENVHRCESLWVRSCLFAVIAVVVVIGVVVVVFVVVVVVNVVGRSCVTSDTVVKQSRALCERQFRCWRESAKPCQPTT